MEELLWGIEEYLYVCGSNLAKLQERGPLRQATSADSLGNLLE
jgi:hypothetical protein